MPVRDAHLLLLSGLRRHPERSERSLFAFAPQFTVRFSSGEFVSISCRSLSRSLHTMPQLRTALLPSGAALALRHLSWRNACASGTRIVAISTSRRLVVRNVAANAGSLQARHLFLFRCLLAAGFSQQTSFSLCPARPVLLS